MGRMRLGLGFDDFRHHVHVHPRLRASRMRPISVLYTPVIAFRWWLPAEFPETGPGKVSRPCDFVSPARRQDLLPVPCLEFSWLYGAF
jgi:hypothetical protein